MLYILRDLLSPFKFEGFSSVYIHEYLGETMPFWMSSPGQVCLVQEVLLCCDWLALALPEGFYYWLPVMLLLECDVPFYREHCGRLPWGNSGNEDKEQTKIHTRSKRGWMTCIPLKTKCWIITLRFIGICVVNFQLQFGFGRIANVEFSHIRGGNICLPFTSILSDQKGQENMCVWCRRNSTSWPLFACIEVVFL